MVALSPIRRPRWRTAVPVAVCIAAVALLLLGGLTHDTVYFRTVSEAVARRPVDHGLLRVAGAVVPGSVHETTTGVHFALTDGVDTVEVDHDGDPPELFKDGAPVVSEGRWRGARFASDRLLIKHGAQYTPPVVQR